MSPDANGPDRFASRPASAGPRTRGTYHVIDVSHHLLRRRADARALAYDQQGGGRDAFVTRNPGWLRRWRVQYRRYDTAIGFSRSGR